MQIKSKDLPSRMPPGRYKIIEALKFLMKKQSFDSITWQDIASTAGVNEALIYKYFKNKRYLLHSVLQEYNRDYLKLLRQHIDSRKEPLDQIEEFIHSTLNFYLESELFAKILIVEVRNFPEYFHSETYEEIRAYTNMLLEIINKGIQSGVIRKDIPPRYMRQMILGIIEHMCLPKVIFQQKYSPEAYTKEIMNFILPAITCKTVAADSRSKRANKVIRKKRG